MAKRKPSSVTPGKSGVKHSIKKSISKGNDKTNVKPKKNIVRAFGEQLLTAPKPQILLKNTPEVGMEVDVQWSDDNTYKAKIVEVEGEECLVHYKGWNIKHDEWLSTKTDTKKRKALGELSNIDINHKSNIGKLNAIKSIEKGIDSTEEGVPSDGSEDNDPEMAGLCEYEKIRLRNIRERQALFEELNITEAKAELSQAFTPSQNKQAPSKRGLASEKRPKEVLPPRKSSRLSGGKVPQIERYIPVVEQFDEVFVSFEDYELKDVYKHSSDVSKLEQTRGFLETVSKLSNCKTSVSFESKPLKSCTDTLKVTEELVAKVVPERIFSLSLHPSSSSLIAAVGDKTGHVGLWDIMDRSSANHGVHLYHPHIKPVNCLSWDLDNRNNLVSTSYDGSSRIFDTEKQASIMLYGEKEFVEDGGWTSFHAQTSLDTFLISKGKTGEIALVDRRVDWRKPASIYQVFDRIHAKTVSVHPVNTNIFVTGNNKGGCFIFDTRTASTSTKLMTPLSELMGHTKSLSSCAFSSTSGDQVVTMSSDDKIRLFDTTTMSKRINPQCQTRHNNQTGRWLTPFRPAWHPLREGMLVTGSMERPRQIEVWNTEGGNLDMVTRLRGEDLGSVCSLVDIHPRMDIVVGGNSSGRVHVFM